ncbi:MAG: hypothetical protein RR561_06550 [Peptostreptococcus sp.]|uniref:hypothetical protein n=1 Tax=Peptostreptococcus sp. TaxID=1262 RepID=UPI002FCB707B
MSLDRVGYKIDSTIKDAYRASFQTVDNEIYYLMLICTKVLYCNKGHRKITVDIDRLYDEFVYFRYYSKMSDDYLLNFFMPLMVVSRSFENYEEEALSLIEKLCKFYNLPNKKYDYTMDLLCYDIVFRKLLLSDTAMIEILYEIKDKLIEFNPYKLNKKENIKFQIRKIKYIENIHKCIDHYEIEKKESFFESEIKLIDILQCAYDVEDVDKSLENMDCGSISVYNFIKKVSESKGSDSLEIKNEKFIDAMGDYLIKIRNIEVNTKKYNASSNPKSFLNMNIGDEFVDPILNQAKILYKDIEKEDGEDKYIIEVSTKTGNYKFRYPKNKK